MQEAEAERSLPLFPAQRAGGAPAPYKRFAGDKTLADCARRRVSERNRRSAAALGAEMGEFTSPEHFNFQRDPKRRTRRNVVSLFLKGTVKPDIFGSAKNRPQGGLPTASPAQRVAVGSEEKARPAYEKSPKAFFIASGLFLSWSGQRGSNSLPGIPRMAGRHSQEPCLTSD